MREKIKRIIERNNNHPDENNDEGKKNYLMNIINRLEGKHLDWLIQVIENRYSPDLKKENEKSQDDIH